MPKCPMCGAKTARKQLMCSACGFALPSSGNPLLGPPPDAPKPGARPMTASRPPAAASPAMPSPAVPASATPARPSLAPAASPTSAPPVSVESVPSTRETNKIPALVLPIGALLIFAFTRNSEAFLFAIGIFAFAGIPALWSLFGWERIIVFGDHIEVRREIFGRKVRYISLPWEAVEEITFEQPKTSYFRGKDRGALWTFGSGPVVISHVAGTYRIAEGYEYLPDQARDLAERLLAAMDSVAPPSSRQR